jgi:hypothetical protein
VLIDFILGPSQYCNAQDGSFSQVSWQRGFVPDGSKEGGPTIGDIWSMEERQV